MTRRHNDLCGVLKKWCEDQGCRVESEVTLPTAIDAAPEARMDLVIRARGVPGSILVDVTVASALAAEPMSKGSSLRESVAAELAAKDKRVKYHNINVIPFVVEDHGRLGEDAIRLIRKLAVGDKEARSRAIATIYQSVGACCQRAAADAVSAATAK